jgi:cyanophycin synthetase
MPHNPHSYEALGSFVRNWANGDRIGVIGGPGDRRDQDFVALGKLSAEIFDYVIIKEDDDTRGRARGSAAELIIQGIKQINPDYEYEAILDETQAINKALDIAPENSLVVILPESVNRAIKLIKARGVVKEEFPQQNTTPPTVDSQMGVTSSVVNSII